MLLGARRRIARPGEHGQGSRRLFEVVCARGTAARRASKRLITAVARGSPAVSLVSAGTPAAPAPPPPAGGSGSPRRDPGEVPGRGRAPAVFELGFLGPGARGASVRHWPGCPNGRAAGGVTRGVRGGSAGVIAIGNAGRGGAAAVLEAAAVTAGRRGSGAERRRARSLRCGPERAGGGRGEQRTVL